MRTPDNGSEFVAHIPCEFCGSRDNRALYSDGHTYCFTCPDDTAYQPPEDQATVKPRLKKGGARVEFIKGEIHALPSRKITEETARLFGYMQATYRGEPVQVANYYDDSGNLVAQHLRTRDKQFPWIGDPKDALPFGSQLWPRTGQMIVVTEGEIDAMAMSQAQGNKYPVVSIGCGAGRQVRKYIAKHRDYFLGFDKVVLMFDMDEPGRLAAQEAAEVIGPKAHIATLPLKDAGEMLQAGRVKELVNAMWRAQRYRPEGVVDLATLKDKIKERPVMGLSWCFDTLTRLTYGKRLGELYAVGAGTGVGKTDFLTQDMRHMVEVHGEKIGVFALEQQPGETGLRLIGKLAERPIHIPDYWDEAVFDSTWDRWIKEGQVFLYDSFGVNTYESIEDKIRYLVHAEGVRWFYLDHITALAAAIEDDERKALDNIMGKLGSLVKELNISIIFVSHLATPDGKPHEEGGRVMIRHFRGSRAIGFWAHYIFGLERNQQAGDPIVRTTTTFRVLKDRYTGRATGEVFYLRYDQETGMLRESAPPDEAAEYGFADESLPVGAAADGDSDF